jgi:hypothetical protein
VTRGTGDRQECAYVLVAVDRVDITSKGGAT